MRVGFKTTLEEDIISQIKIKAIELKVDVNDIIESLLKLYLSGDIKVEIEKKK